MYTKALVIFGCFILGALLIAIAIAGMMGVWEKFLWFSLISLQTSMKPVLILIGIGVAFWAFGGILMRSQ